MENFREKNWIISAYIKRDTVLKEPDAEAPSTTPKSNLSATVSCDNNISYDDFIANNYMKNPP